MGRHAPEQEYEIITCYSHFNNTDSSLSGYTPASIPLYFDGQTATGLGLDRLQIPSPYGASGTSITGTEAVFVSGSSSGVPYFNNQFVLITDDKKAINIGTSSGSNNNISGRYHTITNLYRPSIPSNILSTSSGATGFLAQPVSFYFSQITGNYVGGVEKLNDGRYAILSYVGAANTTGGSRVWLTIGSVSSTGVTLETPSLIPNTDNLSVATGLIMPCLVKDLSYTGNVDRVLVGYRAATGVSSGLLCATLAEISGNTITYGDQIAIRSIVITGVHNGSIKACYHPKQTGYVISTTVSGTGTISATSGELIACNPPSGLVLSGYFGTPVVSMASNTTGVTGQINHIACQSLNAYSGIEDYGISIAVARGGLASVSGNLCFQTYQLSGTQIITGTIVEYSGVGSGSFSADRSGTTSTSGTVNRCIVEEPSPTTNSGFISYLGALYSQLTKFNALFLLDYSLTTNVNNVSVFNIPAASANNINRKQARPGIVPDFKIISGNPYGGSVFSALTINTSSGDNLNDLEQPEKRLITIKDDIQAINAASSGYILISGTRTQYVLSSGRSNSFLNSFFNNYFNCNVIDYRGTFPNYSGLTCISATGNANSDNPTGISFVNIVFSSGIDTPGMNYRLTSGVFTKPEILSGTTPSGFALVTYKNMSIGLVVNPNNQGLENDPAAVKITNKEDAFLSTLKVKVPKTERARLNMFNQGLKNIEVIFPYNIFN